MKKDIRLRESKEVTMKELVSQFIANSGKQHLLDKTILFSRWHEYVGEICAKYSKCVDLKNGILVVKVDNAALKFELFGSKSEIVKRINHDFGDIVKDIIFK